jgi:hypothetical protein
MAKKTLTAEEFAAPVDPWLGKSSEIAQKAREEAAAVLAFGSGLITKRNAGLLIGRFAERRVSDYLQARRDGDENDSGTLNPGITIFVTPDQKSSFLEHGILGDPFEEESRGLWSTYYPTGMFYYVPDKGIFRFARGERHKFGFSNGDGAIGAFTLGHDDLVRVEGDDGTLWQNCNFKPDGRKARQIRTSPYPVTVFGRED